MRTANFAPLYRSTVGFDQLFRMLDTMATDATDNAGYPPYNIERTGENDYRITMAVAGFTSDDIDVEVKDGALHIRAEKNSDDQKKREFLHRGIAERSFERNFQLADYVEVVGADISDGLLHVQLQRNLPERMKPRTVAISTNGMSGQKPATQQIEATA
ncbi:MAG: Hsp20 family protein [Pseudomonadota bacterium]